MQQIDREVLEIIRELPGVTRAEIQELMPHKTKSQINWSIGRLKMENLLLLDSKKSASKQGPGQVQTFALNPNPAKPKPKMLKTVEHSTSGLLDTIAELQAKVAELTTWRAQALERFPDLAVPAAVLEAREIVAAVVDDKLAEDVRAGRKDGCPIMLATLAALERKAA